MRPKARFRNKYGIFGEIIPVRRTNNVKRLSYYYKMNDNGFSFVRNALRPNTRSRLKRNGHLGVPFIDLSWMIRRRRKQVNAFLAGLTEPLNKNFSRTPKFIRVA